MISLALQKTLDGFRLDTCSELPGTGFSALLCPSGCRKTTLAACLAGLCRPESGFIRINGKTFFPSEEGVWLTPQARGIGYVFQSHRLFPHLTVRENLFYGRRAGRRSEIDPNALIEVLGIGALLDRHPRTLSGGESQRAALGRALLSAESLLIMDEPLASLDEERRDELLGYFEQIPEVTPLPVLYITHSQAEAERLAGTVIRMKAGRIVSTTTLNHRDYS